MLRSSKLYCSVMLRALLIAACLSRAAPDWVEISQHRYNRAPTRSPTSPTHHQQEQTWPRLQHPARHPSLVHYEDDFRVENVKRDGEIYSNYSITEHNWNQDVHRIPGSVKRVNTNFKKSNVTPEFSLNIYEQVTEIEPESVTRYIPKDLESVSATIERVPNKGSIKRVQLSHTPVKSPSVTEKMSPIRKNDVKFYESPETDDDFSDEFEIRSNNMLKGERTGASGQASQGQVKHFVSSSKKGPFTNYNRIITTTDAPHPGPPFPSYRFPEKNKNKNDSADVENITIDNENSKLGVNVKNTTEHEIPFENIDVNEGETAGKTSDIDTTMNYNPQEKNKKVGDDVKDNSETNNNTRVLEILKQKSDTNSNESKTKHDDESKVNTMENVIKFIKVVADTISKNARRGVGGKEEYLNELKQTLLCTIEDRIDATWPDDATDTRASRRSRSAAARGHVEFPSSESSLMTISFLTFAVFLIKLVLQVIHTYKNKAMMVAPLVVATAGRTVRKLRNFH